MTQVYVIRHAEAEGNIFRRLHGQYNSRITANGERQLAALSARFQTVALDGIYCSDLYRTVRTAQAVQGGRPIPIVTDPRLREVQAGPWEDVPFGYLNEFEPEQMYFFNREPEKWHTEGAESFEEYAGRFLQALTELAAANEGKTLAVVTHGCVSSGAFHRLLGREHNASTCDNTGVSLLRWEGGVFTPEYLYDNSHLSEEISTRARQRWWRATGKAFNLWYRDPEPEDRALYDPDFLPPRGHRIRIAMLKRQPVGYLCYDESSVSVLYLLPEYRHIRMGDQLLGEAVTALRRQGQTILRAGVPTANVEALAFFSRLGAAIEQMDDVYTVFGMDIGVPGETKNEAS